MNAFKSLLCFMGLIMSQHAFAADARATVLQRSLEIDGVRVFYREAGPVDAPVVLLLHGFPTSSHMYRNLIPALASRYRVVAPDYPGFGFSDFPPGSKFEYSFANYARLMKAFTERIGVRQYAMYIQDYGAPIGLRLALLAPERVTALVVQNGNAYEEGLSSGWDPLKAFWKDPSSKNREQMRGWLTEQGTREQYLAGLTSEQIALVAPENWALDWSLLSRPGAIDMQLDLFGDYANNVKLYPQFQAFLRERSPPVLIAWGKFDPYFTVEGAQAYRRDVPDAELHLLDTSHFALETHSREIAALMLDFLDRKIAR